MAKHTERQDSPTDESPQVQRESQIVAREGAEEREIDRERIAARAYERYLARGREEGRDLDDWLEAEREIREQRDR